MTENWRAVPGFLSAYEVSDQGRVRSLSRDLLCAGKHGLYVRRVPGRILKPGRCSSGHATVMLGREGGSQYVHVLVTRAFLGVQPIGREVRHLDGDPANNVLTNLEYATRSRNVQDKKWHRGQKGYRLAPVQVADIKRRLARPHFGIGASLARFYGVAQSTISAIKHDRFHCDVEAGA